MKYKILVLLIQLISTLLLNGQVNRARNWVFGDGLQLKFAANNKLIPSNYRKIKFTEEGTGTISDNNGNLTFYSDFNYLYDSSDNKLNLDFTLGSDGSSAQGSQLITIDDSLLHCFSTSTELYDSKFQLGGFNYSIYNMKLKRWEVQKRKLRYTSAETQCAVFNQNGNWAWVANHSRLGDTIFTYLISQSGLINCSIVNKCGPFFQDWAPGQGILKFSPDGKLLAMSSWTEEKVTICSFNNQTGEIKELFQIDNTIPTGLEFKGDKLFVVQSRNESRLFEYDLSILNKTAVENSRRKLFDTSESQYMGQLQLAPDGNIYAALAFQNRLGKIYKNVSDQYEFGYTPALFGSKVCYAGFPNFNASYFYQPTVQFGYDRNCKKMEFAFKGKDNFEAQWYKYYFSKGNILDSAIGQNPVYTFKDSGIWKVVLKAGKYQRVDSFVRNIWVQDALKKDFIGDDVKIKKGKPITGVFKAPSNLHCAHWKKFGDTIEIKANNYSYNSLGKYVCEVTTKTFCQYFDTIEVIQCDTLPRPSITRNRDTLILLNNFNYYKAQWKKKYTNINAPQTAKYTLADTGLYYCVVSTTQGCTDSSAGMFVDFLYATTKTNSINRSFQIYPNPNTGLFTISSSSEPIKSIEIYNVIGQLVYTKNGINNNSLEINLGNKKGIYFLKINCVMSRKMIVE